MYFIVAIVEFQAHGILRTTHFAVNSSKYGIPLSPFRLFDLFDGDFFCGLTMSLEKDRTLNRVVLECSR
jgi:hypothetical protein